MRDVADVQTDEMAATKLAVDGKVVPKVKTIICGV
jgi:hypothetical protein